MSTFKKAIDALNIEYKTAPQPKEFSVFTGQADTPLDFQTHARDVPCQAACPAKTNVPGYIEEIAKGNPDKAFQINQECNVFPGVLGRICTRPCEDSCRYKWTNITGPVQICHLKRFSADMQPKAPKPLPAWYDDSGKKVAIIGGGPAGLTAARELRRYGHAVTVFEKEAMLGGMMVQGIPSFRLPRYIVQTEIAAIIDSGIEVELNHPVDAARMQELMDAYDAVIVAAGAVRPVDLKLPGADDAEYFPGVEFMHDYNLDKISEMKGDVIVIGGGFTAVDCARGCARAARKLVGADDKVSIVYRRTTAQMSANMDELEELERENISVETLATPLAVKTKDGRITHVTMQRNKLGMSEPGEKPPITPIEGSEYDEPCTHLIVAIGQERTLEILPEGVEIQDKYTTNSKGLFVAGDFAYGSLDVIHAVAEGKETAEHVDQFLTGEQRKREYIEVQEADNIDGHSGRVRDHDHQNKAQMPVLPIQKRMDNAEVETGYHENEASVNATRCYFCHYKFEIDQDKCIHCDWCIKAAPRECILKVSRVFEDDAGGVDHVVEANRAKDATFIWIDSDECIRCGNCLRVCPTNAITMRKEVPMCERVGAKTQPVTI